MVPLECGLKMPKSKSTFISGSLGPSLVRNHKLEVSSYFSDSIVAEDCILDQRSPSSDVSLALSFGVSLSRGGKWGRG
jgi:hypothetical protein